MNDWSHKTQKQVGRCGGRLASMTADPFRSIDKGRDDGNGVKRRTKTRKSGPGRVSWEKDEAAKLILGGRGALSPPRIASYSEIVMLAGASHGDSTVFLLAE